MLHRFVHWSSAVSVRRNRRVFALFYSSYRSDSSEQIGTSVLSSLLDGTVNAQDLSDYNANRLISHACKTKKHRKAFQLYDKIKKAHEIQPLTWKHLLISSTHVEGKTNDLLRDIRAFNVDVDHIILGGMMISLANQNQMNRALQICDKIIDEQSSLHSFDCSIVITQLIKKGMPEEAKKLYHRSNTEFKELLFDHFIKESLAVEYFDDILYWYHEMEKFELLMDNFTVDQVIFHCTKADRQSIVYELIEQLSINKNLNVHIYETLFRSIIADKSLTPEEKVQKGKYFFSAFVASGKPLNKNSTLLEYVLDLYMTSESPEDAKEFLRVIHKQNFEIHASMIYRIADKYSKSEDLAPLICQLLERVKNKGSPAVRSLVYSKLMNLCCEQRDIKRAIQYLGDMKNARLVPNGAIYSQLFVACCKSQRIDDIVNLRTQSAHSFVGLSRPLYTLIIDTMLKSHREENISLFFSDATEASHRIDLGEFALQEINDAIKESFAHIPRIDIDAPRRTNTHTEECFHVLSEFVHSCLQGDLDHAESFIDTFHKKGFPLPEMVGTYLIRFHGKNGNIAKANELFDKNVSSFSTTNFYQSIIDIVRFTDASPLPRLEEMKSRQLQPNLAIYNAVLDFHVKAENLKDEEAMEYILREMAERDISGDETTFRLFVNGLCRIGRLDKAKEVIGSQQDMFKSQEPHLLLVKCYCQHDQAEQAVEFVIKQEIISTSLVRPITDLFLKKKEEKKLQELVSLLEEKKMNPVDISGCFTTSVDARPFSGKK